MWDCRCVFYCIHAKRERARRARRYQPSNLASNPPSKVTFSFIIPTVAPVPENEVFLFLFFINCSNSNHSMSFLLVFFEYYCLFLIMSYTHTYITLTLTQHSHPGKRYPGQVIKYIKGRKSFVFIKYDDGGT